MNAPLNGVDACVLMHAGLRKCCNSPATSAMYNLIRLINAYCIVPTSLDPWRMLGELVADEMRAGHAPEQALRCCAGLRTSILEDRWEALVEERRKAGKREPEGPDAAREALYALLGTLRCFSPADFEGMATYLKEGA